MDASVFGKSCACGKDWRPLCCASPSKEKGADSLVRVNMRQLMETSASACLVKPKFATPDVPQYDQRCFPDDDSWLKLRQKLRDFGNWAVEDVMRKGCCCSWVNLSCLKPSLATPFVFSVVWFQAC